MSLTRIERRLKAIEAMCSWVRLDKHPPLTRSQIADIERRVRSGEQPTELERALVQRQSPIVDGELMMTCHRGQVFVKRYIGIDLVEV